MAITKKRQSSTSKVAARPTRSKRAAKKPLLLHYRHSFKLVHHRHTSYPLTMFLLLLSVTFSVGWTAFASGDAYVVNAVVPAAPLLAAATIATPSDGDHFTMDIITVTGGCPANSYVKLFRNRMFAGTGLCQSGAWSIQISLQPGTNTLDAQVYNVTDQPGPISPDVTVLYDLPQSTIESTHSATKPTGTPDETTNTIGSPLVLQSAFTYKGYFSNQLSSWPFSITGGKAPYAVQIDWGDGQTDLKSLSSASDFVMEHTYAQAGGFLNSYTIKVTATDSDGQTSILQLFTIVSPIGSGMSAGPDGITGLSGGASTTPSGGNGSIYQRFWKIAGPTFAVSGVAVASFWLGQMHEIELLRPRSLHLRVHRWRH